MDFVRTLELRHVNPSVAGQQIRDLLVEAKVVKIIPGWHISDLRGFYDEVTESVGSCVMIGEDFTKGGIQTGEKWLEIRYDHDIPDLAAYRHSKNAQPYHTDESYMIVPADIMFFYCINKAESGGATTFVDGPVLVNYLKSSDSQLLEDLMKNEICYKKADQYRKQPIISFNEEGTPLFNFNYYCIDKDESESNKALNKRFFDFLKNQVEGSEMVYEVYLNPGESVAWWDEYVLHGRSSFKAEKTNDRFIWKTGIKWTN